LKKQSQFVPCLIGTTSYLKGNYDKNSLCEARKNKPKQSQYAGEAEHAQAIPIPIQDNRDEAATQGKLKKQSQFVGRQNNAKLVITMVYGDFNDFGQRKNKANLKPKKMDSRLRGNDNVEG